jgi:hypothetical protein
MDQRRAIELAEEHLHADLAIDVKPLSEYRLHPQLQLRLCRAFFRVNRTAGEVTRQDVLMLVEAWCMARPEHVRALLHKSEMNDGDVAQAHAVSCGDALRKDATPT